MFPIQFAGATAALAMVGLSEIGEFEIRRECFGHVIGAGQVHPRDNLLRLEHEFRRRSLLRTLTRRFAVFDQKPTQLFYRIEQVLPGLLHQYLSENRS